MSETLTALAVGTVGGLVVTAVVYVSAAVALVAGDRTKTQEAGQ